MLCNSCLLDTPRPLIYDEEEGVWTFTMPAGDVTVSAAFQPIPVTVVTEPADVTADLGGRAVFTVEARGVGLAYQWHYQTPAGNTFDSSCQTAVYSFLARPAYDGREIWCTVTDAAGNTAETAHAKLTVARDGVVILTQPADVTGADLDGRLP